MRINPTTASRFRIYAEPASANKGHANFVDEARLLTENPQITPYDDLTYIARTAIKDGKIPYEDRLSMYQTPLNNWLEGRGNVKTITTEYKNIRWKLYGDDVSIRPIALDQTESGDAIGKGFGEFELKMDVDFYVYGDVLAPEINKRVQVMVVSEYPEMDGAGFVYKVRLVTEDANAAFPAKYLKSGLYWCKLIGGFQGEASMNESSIIFGGKGSSYVEFESNLSRVGYKFTLTNETHHYNLRVQEVDPTTQEAMPENDKILTMMEAEAMNQIAYNEEMWMWYGTRMRGLLDETSNYEANIGPGLMEFIEDSNVIPYHKNQFSIEMITHLLNSLWYDRVEYQNRDIVLLTGSGGLDLFNKAVRQKYGDAAVAIPVDWMIEDAPGNDRVTQATKGLKDIVWTKYNLPLAGSITVGYLASLDNTQMCPIKDPDTGYPVSSFEFLSLDIKMGDASQNAVKYKRNDSTYSYWSAGNWTPFGYRNSGNTAANSVAYDAGAGGTATWHYGHEFGIALMDVSKVLWIKPAWAE